MQTALDELTSNFRDIERGTLPYDVVDFHLPPLKAIVIEFSRLPSMFGFLTKFSRAAVLRDKKWLQKISESEGALSPGLEIRAFDRAQRAAVQAWLSGADGNR